MDEYEEFLRERNLRRCKLRNREVLLSDINNIDYSLISAITSNMAITFLFESSQLLYNSIFLYEDGYFDAAYYLLRQSIEIMTLMVYLEENPNLEFDSDKWKTVKSYFPDENKMLKHLKDNGTHFKDIKMKIPVIFNEITEVNKELNKFVHKQGLKNLYVVRNKFIGSNKIRENSMDEEYIYYLKKVIRIVGIMRLAIDPFPVMLNDPEIYYRTESIMTRKYEQRFIDEYIGADILEKYKKTEIYLGFYNNIIVKEKMNPAITSILKDKYINRERKTEIYEQIHLLDKISKFATELIFTSKKICNVYFENGWYIYFTENNSRRKFSYSYDVFMKLTENVVNYNQIYDNTLISYFRVDEKYYFLEHNEKFNEIEIDKIIKYFSQNNYC